MYLLIQSTVEGKTSKANVMSLKITQSWEEPQEAPAFNHKMEEAATSKEMLLHASCDILPISASTAILSPPNLRLVEPFLTLLY